MKKLLFLILFPVAAYCQIDTASIDKIIMVNTAGNSTAISSALFKSWVKGTVSSTQKRQETYSGTTNGSGIYTVVFPVAFSVTPNIQASMPVQANTNQYLRISALSTTGFTVNAYSFNTNTLLGIVGLVSATTALSSIAVDAMVTQK